jgi:hypothetical protein
MSEPLKSKDKDKAEPESAAHKDAEKKKTRNLIIGGVALIIFLFGMNSRALSVSNSFSTGFNNQGPTAIPGFTPVITEPAGLLKLVDTEWSPVILKDKNKRLYGEARTDHAYVAVMLDRDPSRIFIIPPENDVGMIAAFKTNVIVTSPADAMQFMVTNINGSNVKMCEFAYKTLL